jgi:cytoskeletal protein RodZ
MEENENQNMNNVPNQEPVQNVNNMEQQNVGQEPVRPQVNPEAKKVIKKKKHPFVGLLIALLIAVLIIGIGLLIRMEIAGDGDYFAPIKKIFGMSNEEENTSKKSSKKDDNKNEVVDTKKESAGRLSLLSSRIEEDGVTHYTFEISFEDVIDLYKEMQENGELDANELLPSISLNKKSTKVEKMSELTVDEKDIDLEDYNWEDLEATFEDEVTTYGDTNMNTTMSSPFEILENEEMLELIEGNFYVDLYVKGNELIHFVIGFDYMPLAENFYDYSVKNGDEQVKAFDDAEDYAKYINTTLKMFLTEDTIIDSIKEQLDEQGIQLSKKELDAIIDLSLEPGLFEFYINGTDKLNDALSDLFEENIDDMKEAAKEVDIDLDEDNVFQAFVDLINKEIKEAGYKYKIKEAK